MLIQFPPRAMADRRVTPAAALCEMLARSRPSGGNAALDQEVTGVIEVYNDLSSINGMAAAALADAWRREDLGDGRNTSWSTQTGQASKDAKE